MNYFDEWDDGDMNWTSNSSYFAKLEKKKQGRRPKDLTKIRKKVRRNRGKTIDSCGRDEE